MAWEGQVLAEAAHTTDSQCKSQFVTCHSIGIGTFLFDYLCMVHGLINVQQLTHNIMAKGLVDCCCLQLLLHRRLPSH